MNMRAVVFNDLGLAGQHKAHGPAGRHDTQRLVSCIKNERASHGSASASPVRAVGTVPISRPFQVVNHVIYIRVVIRRAVLGDKAKPHVRLCRNWKKRRSCPPASGHHTPALANCSHPQPRACDDREQKADIRASAHLINPASVP